MLSKILEIFSAALNVRGSLTLFRGNGGGGKRGTDQSCTTEKYNVFFVLVRERSEAFRRF